MAESESFRRKAEQERALASTLSRPSQVRQSLDLARRLDAVADAYDRLEQVRSRAE